MSPRPLLAALLPVLLLAACKQAEEKTAPNQVIARVGNAEITVHQLNYLLAQHGEQADAATKQQILDSLIDQELLVQRAVEIKLDRDPGVVQALEAARRQVLAQAAAERSFAKPLAPTQAEVNAFVEGNPLLFKERKRYDFEVFALGNNVIKPEHEAALDQAKTARDTAALLTRIGVPYQQSAQHKVAEQLPMQLLPKIAAMHAGDIVAMRDGDQTLLLQLVSSEPAPADAGQQAETIKRYLQTTAAQTRFAEQLGALHASSKIEYLQRFASAVAMAPGAGQDAAADHLKAGVRGLQ
ncbi:peptidyl-prolyl cis-trans isomerase, EpsD family [Andreprevotia lacus DSM 23236]|jgi:EpsD family peptidyl-prolyl cis-trans isomerase|uniref:Peptidyl-prolyl cis-trans isomerase, EpsD family n=1 Tax=Andreprevotia lacus DSM 23236 TaxID=1121001 RepID=A0A1W1XGW6_9NEIS|nr:EpsD family peptidyl-prolyl cis-trans isomerase [Andreprevotia lacus]SMC23014.1 peptidyl-prolyl cis-trans isomerase, EpsD family [Andreprevotia lacus DSM 23236]